MTTARNALLLSLTALAIAAPVQASAVYHAAGGEIGYTRHPDHQPASSRQRSEVLGEIEAARKDGTLALLSRGMALPLPKTALAKTREQVQEEYLGMTDAEKRRLQEMHGAGG
ncbi:DUF4148 domain-containing protein [Acidovorax sp. A1169]|uniref:DUF4148 domain-containing protein n=1 Tax=Acidovorax sp. A1169 TaxID=3059524 RepID=UPI002737A49F|nr:DUF4148 domain-containing protein [Acidovorax sp. A1169]MDP4077031.1 DUF4148 domain-containing protein [Acidovorax sp. A1169]